MKRRLLVAALALGMALGEATVAVAQGRDESASVPYPIWLSPSLDIKSFSEIEARLDRPLDSDERVEVTRNGVASSRQPARTCNQMLSLAAQGYKPDAGVDSYLYAIQKTTCEAVTMLRRVQPAKDSLVRTFVMSEIALRFLPARIDPSVTCGSDGRWPGGDLTSTPWRDYYGFEGVGGRGRPVVTVRNQSEMQVKTAAAEMTFELLARGDFNGDGYEDLIVRASRDLSGASPGVANVFVMTREVPDAILRLVDDRCAPNATSVRPR